MLPDSRIDPSEPSLMGPNFIVGKSRSGVPMLVCRLCDLVSHNSNDVRHLYCGRCHRFLNDPIPSVETDAQQHQYVIETPHPTLVFFSQQEEADAPLCLDSEGQIIPPGDPPAKGLMDGHHRVEAAKRADYKPFGEPAPIPHFEFVEPESIPRLKSPAEIPIPHFESSSPAAEYLHSWALLHESFREWRNSEEKFVRAALAQVVGPSPEPLEVWAIRLGFANADHLGNALAGYNSIPAAAWNAISAYFARERR